MQQVKDYVDVMFKQLPQTKEVLDMKRNILDSMEEKYLELIESGMKESQAVGQVIGEFGSIEEIKEALDLNGDSKEYYTSEFVNEYLDYVPKFALRIASGVSLIIGGVIAVNILDKTIFEPLAMAFFFGCIAIAVGIFITNGIKLSGYNFSDNQILSISDQEKVDSTVLRNTRKLGLFVSIGVGLILFGVAMESIISEYMPAMSYDGTILLSCVAIAVFIFINTGVNATLPKRFEEGEQITKDRLESEDRWGQATGAIMGLVAMLYVGLGLWQNYLFGILWIMFPVAALLMVLLRAIFEKK